ncbi:MAG: alpha/beta hydrolase domain-containing protein, partial [Dehalococcoidia bacterium]
MTTTDTINRPPTLRRGMAFALLAGITWALAATAGAVVPTPEVEGPISSSAGAFITPPIAFDLAPGGYLEEEFYVSGTATAYTSADPLDSDGQWTAAPGDTAAYVTRILVRRPARRRKFNGTVVVEWHNVSGGLDAAPDWTYAHTLLMRNGFAWVGVSAQHEGVEGGGGSLGLNLSLKAVDPARYGSLAHPGDSFS